MIVDIIELSDEEFQKLTSVQLAMVYSAQTQKNEILAKAETEKQKRLNTLLSHNVARSSMLEDSISEIDADAQMQVDVIREDLLYRLAYEGSYSDGNENGTYRYPENPNYNLSYEQRFLVVRDYYMHLTSNAQTRLSLFGLDSLAPDYLGQYYQTLYDLLASYCK